MGVPTNMPIKYYEGMADNAVPNWVREKRAQASSPATTGLGLDPNTFWDQYEERYGIPNQFLSSPPVVGPEPEQAMQAAAASQQQFHNLTNDLLMQFEENWRNTFGGRGDLFPEVAPHRDVTQAYQDVLQRRPDLEGLEYWTDKHQRKGGLSQILPQFKAAAQDEIEGRK